MEKAGAAVVSVLAEREQRGQRPCLTLCHLLAALCYIELPRSVKRRRSLINRKWHCGIMWIGSFGGLLMSVLG